MLKVPVTISALRLPQLLRLRLMIQKFIIQEQLGDEKRAREEEEGFSTLLINDCYENKHIELGGWGGVGGWEWVGEGERGDL